MSINELLPGPYRKPDSRQYRDTSRYLPSTVRLSTIDYARMAEIDRFYIRCQQYRDYYKGHKDQGKESSNLMAYFKAPQKMLFKYNCNPTTECMKHLTGWKRMKQPIVFFDPHCLK